MSKIKSIKISVTLSGHGVVGYNGHLNKELAKLKGVIDAAAAEFDNFKLPLFTVKNEAAHLTDSVRHFRSRLDPECRQQTVSYITDNLNREGQARAGALLARPEMLMFGYLITRKSETSLKRAAPVRMTSFVDKKPTVFVTEVVTQRGPKKSADEDKSSTSLSYTVGCGEVEMEGSIFVDVGELLYLPIGAQRDRPALSADQVSYFVQEINRKFSVSLDVPSTLPKYVRATGDADVAEEGIQLPETVGVQLLQDLVGRIKDIDYNMPGGSRQFKSASAVIKFVDGTEGTVSVEEMLKLAAALGLQEGYKIGTTELDKLPHLTAADREDEGTKKKKKVAKKD